MIGETNLFAVGNLDDGTRQHDHPGHGLDVNGSGIARPCGGERLRIAAVVRGMVDDAVLNSKHRGRRRTAQPYRALHDRVEHCLRVLLGAADDAKDLASGCLSLKRCREFGVARLQLLEQPHVLNGDDRLVGECLHERDLLLAEGLPLNARDRDVPDRLTVPQKRHCEHAAPALLTGELA